MFYNERACLGSTEMFSFADPYSLSFVLQLGAHNRAVNTTVSSHCLTVLVAKASVILLWETVGEINFDS